jgi:hypothetical protein
MVLLRSIVEWKGEEREGEATTACLSQTVSEEGAIADGEVQPSEETCAGWADRDDAYD